MAIEKISENKRKQIINKSVNPLPNNPSKAGYKADEIKKAMFNFVTDEKDSIVDEINRIVDETNASFDDIDNTNQETSKTIESINNTIKQINDTVSNKVDKEEGKHLSSNDFSNEEKEKLATLNNYDDSEVRAGIDEINSKISAQASSTNQLADKDFVNSSIETATATFKGTFEDLDLLKTTPADNNDYAFYDHISNSNRVFDRYKFNGTEWVYEYTLNNSSFTDAQWKAINSGATAELINKTLTNADNINTILNTLNNIDTRLNNAVDKSSPEDISGLKNFTERPTVNNTEVALKTDIAEGSGTTVFVNGDPVTEFNADSKLDATAKDSYLSLQRPTNEIPANADLNTVTYLNIGNYSCPLNGIVETLKNCPTTQAFNLHVLSTVNTANDSNSAWSYRVRIIIDLEGKIFSQYAHTSGVVGDYVFNNWKQMSSLQEVADTYLPLTGGILKGNLTVKTGSDWGQYQAYSSSGHYRALEACDTFARIDVRDTTSTANRRFVDIYSGSAQADNDFSILIGRDNSTDGYSGTYVATQNWANKYFLKLTGGTLTGALSVEGAIRRKNNNVAHNETPTSSSTTFIAFSDKNNNDYAVVDCVKGSDGRTDILFNVKSVNGTWASSKGTIKLSIDKNGNVTTSAITPATTDNSTAIATTAWFNNKIYNRTSVNALTASTNWANNSNLPTLNTIAFWDGSHQTNGHVSNLKYAQTPSITDSSNRIATTAWANPLRQMLEIGYTANASLSLSSWTTAKIPFSAQKTKIGSNLSYSAGEITIPANIGVKYLKVTAIITGNCATSTSSAIGGKIDISVNGGAYTNKCEIQTPYNYGGGASNQFGMTPVCFIAIDNTVVNKIRASMFHGATTSVNVYANSRLIVEAY